MSAIPVTGDDSGDGRHIDPERGILSGEAAGQIVRERDERRAHEFEVFSANPADRDINASYYGRPVLKNSVWTWDIPAYYVIGGIAGMSGVLGAAATLLDREELPHLVRATRWVGVGGASISAVLLIHDLGRPARFLHMLRVFRPTSPMSMGTWILSSFSSLISLAWISEFAPRRFRTAGDFAAVLAGVFGLGLAGYTGVLVGNTVVPVWQRSHRVLPVLFLASAAAGATALFDLWEGNARELRIAGIFGAAGKLTEFASIHVLERNLRGVPETLMPLRSGKAGRLWRLGKVLSVAGLVLSVFSHRSRRVRQLNGVVATIGAACLKFAIHYAGDKSTRDPQATFRMQRAGQGAFEVTGKAAVTGPGGERALNSPVSPDARTGTASDRRLLP